MACRLKYGAKSSRTDEEMEYRLFPRLFSVAERAWHQAAWEQDYLKEKL